VAEQAKPRRIEIGGRHQAIAAPSAEQEGAQSAA
jgi:hypothetical protein